MSILKSADATKVVPLFPERRVTVAEPLLVDRLAEYNRRELERRRVRRNQMAIAFITWVLCAFAAACVGAWIAS